MRIALWWCLPAFDRGFPQLMHGYVTMIARCFQNHEIFCRCLVPWWVDVLFICYFAYWTSHYDFLHLFSLLNMSCETPLLVVALWLGRGIYFSLDGLLWCVKTSDAVVLCHACYLCYKSTIFIMFLSQKQKYWAAGSLCNPIAVNVLCLSLARCLSNIAAALFGLGTQNGYAILSTNSGSVWGCMPLAGTARLSDLWVEQTTQNFEENGKDKQNVHAKLYNFVQTFTKEKFSWEDRNLIEVPFHKLPMNWQF